MPGFIKPQLATLKSKAPNGEQWLHEIKYDGYRIQVHLNRGRKKIYTRNGLDWTKRFTEIAPVHWPYRAKPSSTGRWWSSMTAAPISPSCKRNWPRAGRVGSSIMPSTFSGEMATFNQLFETFVTISVTARLWREARSGCRSQIC